MTPAALDRFIERMPKAELHLHLEGSIRPATLLRLASRHRVDLPATTVEGVREWFRFADFAEFVEIYLTCSACLRDPEDFQLAADELMAELERQNVVYCEAHLTVGTHAGNGVNLGELADAMAEVIDEGRRRRGVTLRLITDIVRNVAAAGRPDPRVGAGRAGARPWWRSGCPVSSRSPTTPFREHFAEAERQGLHRVAHAGENTDAANIRAALAECRPERIGHGIRAVEDPALMEELRGGRRAARGLPELQRVALRRAQPGGAPVRPAGAGGARGDGQHRRSGVLRRDAERGVPADPADLGLLGGASWRGSRWRR